jgi:SOS-response transcriptional repressor LexA
MTSNRTNRQDEYFKFIRDYVWSNESAPRLKEIADHFRVTLPTAHKALTSLQSRGLLYFARDRVTGFFIRIPDRIGTTEPVFDINIVGKVNRYGEIHEFSKKIGHFPVILPGINPNSVFAIELQQHIPPAYMQAGDLLVLDHKKIPTSGDIGIMRYGKSRLLIRLFSITQDPSTPFYELVKEISPDDLQTIEKNCGLFWWPLALNDETEEYFTMAAIQYQEPWKPLLPEHIIATAIRLERLLTI